VPPSDYARKTPLPPDNSQDARGLIPPKPRENKISSKYHFLDTIHPVGDVIDPQIIAAADKQAVAGKRRAANIAAEEAAIGKKTQRDLEVLSRRGTPEPGSGNKIRRLKREW